MGILGKAGEKVFLLGNEAFARGVLESGVGFVSGYPGTPSSEIIDSLADATREQDLYVEWATNEAVGLEAAFAASLTNVRSFFACKHVGLNVASDPLATIGYIGAPKAGFAFVVADDPHCHSSQNEQDTRNFARTYGLGLLEPSTVQEAKEFPKRAYELSEETELPIMIRSTTRLSHARAIVELGTIPKIKTKGRFEKNPSRYVVVPPHARMNHKKLLERIKNTKKLSNETNLNRIEKVSGNDPPVGQIGIVSSGVAYTYAIEAIESLGIAAKVLKLGMSYPLPERKIVSFMEGLDSVLIVEEIDPLLEKEIKSIAFDHKIHSEIYGTEILPDIYELRPEIVEKGIRYLSHGTVKKVPPAKAEISSQFEDVALPNRPAILCPGCPHRSSYFLVKKALREEGIDPEGAIFPTDIGCMTLGLMPPFRMGDLLLCMGSSIGTSNGLSQTTDQPVVGFIGDSTFFHTGLPALTSAIWNDHPILIAILDNSYTAMTGFQPDPVTGKVAMGGKARSINIAKLTRAMGAHVEEANPVLNYQQAKEKFKNALKAYQEGKVAVMIFKHPCALMERREKRKVGEGGSYEIDTEACVDCGTCYQSLNCPAIFYDEKRGAPYIRKDICVGCGFCLKICPVNAIKRKD